MAATSPGSELLVAYRAVQHLSQALTDGMGGLGHVPMLLEEVLENDYWKRRVSPATGEVIEFDRFEDFVTTKVYWGLGATVQQVKNLLRDNPKLIDLMDKAMQRTVADNKPLDNIQEQAPSGTSAEAAIRRLRKYRPDLHAKVVAGELSANAAAIQAGFRKRMISVPATDLTAAVRILCKHYDPLAIADAAARERPDWKGRKHG